MATCQLLYLAGFQSAGHSNAIGNAAIKHIGGCIFVIDHHIAGDIVTGNIGNIQSAAKNLDFELVLAAAQRFLK